MSETLPPITRTGVLLRFIYPFSSLPRSAAVFWRRLTPKVDTKYAEISQGGEADVVHEQVTFPGDAWVVKAGDLELAYHVATGEREQTIVIRPGAATYSSTAAAAAVTAPAAPARWCRARRTRPAAAAPPPPTAFT